MSRAFLVDIGSTFTKAALVDLEAAAVVARADTPTTLGTDVMDGVAALRDRLGAGDVPTLACSSAGGGLRLAVVGYEALVTAEAGQRVGLSAGAKVVHVHAGPLDRTGIDALRAARPDIVLLVGGTDGGNSEVLRHNAARLATARLPRRVPIVVAGNAEAADQVAATLAARGRAHTVAPNVLPRIGVVAPDGARAAIREAFLTHVIGGKGLSRDPAFASLVRAATPDAVLRGVEVLASALGQDVLVVDVGGATTDVYSSVDPAGERSAGDRGPGGVVAQLRHARTVEADLGLRWNAEAVLEAAARERLPVSDDVRAHAATVQNHPDQVPTSPAEAEHDLALATLAATVAVRRHARPAHPGEPPRRLTDVGLVLGSGGVLRHGDPSQAGALLRAVTADRAGGWPLPRAPRLAVDAAYLLVVVGLLADTQPQVAAALARRLAAGEPVPTAVDGRGAQPA